jgi:hypothetical protein
MKYYGYIKAKTNEELETKRNEIIVYVKDKNIEINFITSLENLEENSQLYLDCLCSFGSTIYQILSAFFELQYKKINITTIKDKFYDTKLGFITYEVLIELLNFEKKNIKNRLSKTKITLIKKEKTVGRKKGKKTKSVFDKHKRIIFKELEKEITQVEILKKLKLKDSDIKDITPQALGKYIKKQKKLIQENYIDPYSDMRSIFD